MTNVRKLLVAFAVASAIAYGLAGPLSAEQGDDNGGGPKPKPDKQCQQNCRMTNHLCMDGAHIALQMCKQSTCGDQLQAAEDACASDDKSDACESARAALHACLQPCRDTFKTTVGTCKDDGQTCVAACPPEPPHVPGVPPGHPDKECADGCHATFETCRMGADDTTQSCREGCASLIDTAKQTCASDPSSSDCTAAIQAARDCLDPCKDARKTAELQCLQDAQGCIAACPTASPKPEPSPKEKPTPKPKPTEGT